MRLLRCVRLLRSVRRPPRDFARGDAVGEWGGYNLCACTHMCCPAVLKNAPQSGLLHRLVIHWCSLINLCPLTLALYNCFAICLWLWDGECDFFTALNLNDWSLAYMPDEVCTFTSVGGSVDILLYPSIIIISQGPIYDTLILKLDTSIQPRLRRTLQIRWDFWWF